MVRRLHSPDDDDKPFIARWNMLARILLVESSVKLVARSAMDFADFEDGTSCHPSNERISRESGLSERTVRFAWQVMRLLGMAERVGNGVPHLRLADEYELRIPEHWRNLPILGPHARKFTCLHCGKLFTPQGNCDVVRDDNGREGVTFDLRRLAFCPAPRKTKGRETPDCWSTWNEQRIHAGEPPWAQLGDERWKLFRQARGDDW